MSKAILFIVVILAVLYGYRAYISPSPAPSNEMVSNTESSPAASSRYLSFSPTVLSSSSAARRVLFFYASWCPTCRPADADFTARSSEIPEDVTLIRVNYNDPDTDLEEKALAAKYGITYQHTFVQIDSDGGVVSKWNGGQLSELLKNLK